MRNWRIAVVLMGVALGPVAADAAPEGRVVIAQGVDPDHARHDAPAGAARLQRGRADLRVAGGARPGPEDRARAGRRDAEAGRARRSWEIKLRRGVKFHNGEDFNAESVKFSLERLANPANKLRGSTSFAPIDRVEIVDPFTVKVHTKKPWPVFVSTWPCARRRCTRPRSTRARTRPRSRRIPSAPAPTSSCAGQGRGDRDGGLRPVLGAGAPKIKTVVFKPIPDDAVRVAALQNGEIDVAVNIPPHLAGIIEKHPKIFLSTAPSIRTIQLMIYTHQYGRQPQAHRPLRRARPRTSACARPSPTPSTPTRSSRA